MLIRAQNGRNMWPRLPRCFHIQLPCRNTSSHFYDWCQVSYRFGFSRVLDLTHISVHMHNRSTVNSLEHVEKYNLPVVLRTLVNMWQLKFNVSLMFRKLPFSVDNAYKWLTFYAHSVGKKLLLVINNKSCRMTCERKWEAIWVLVVYGDFRVWCLLKTVS